MASIQEIQNAVQQWENFQGAYSSAANSLQNVITLGTLIYNNPVYSELFPNSFGTYQQYLLNLKSAIDTFVAAVPAAPPLG